MKNLTQSMLTTFVLLILPMQAVAADDIKLYSGIGVGSYVIAPGSGEDIVFGGYGLVGVEVMPNLGLELRVGSNTEGSNLISKYGTDWFTSYLIRPQMKLEKVNIYGLIGGSTIKSWYAPAGGTKTRKVHTSFSFGGGVEYMFYQDYFIGLEAFAMDPRDRSGVVPYNGNLIGAISLTLRVY